jgi:N-methylhydantoinase A
MPFGGAGPLHAAALAEGLGISRVLCPQASGVLCALGLAAAAPRRDLARTVMLRGAELSQQRLIQEREELVAETCDILGEPVARLRVSHELRYRGQSFELAVEEDRYGEEIGARLDPNELRTAFAHLHEQRYGYADEHGELELVNLRISAWGVAPALRLLAGSATRAQRGKHTVVLEGHEMVAEIHYGKLEPGTPVQGPSICVLDEATLLIPAGWSGHADEHGTIHLLRA